MPRLFIFGRACGSDDDMNLSSQSIEPARCYFRQLMGRGAAKGLSKGTPVACLTAIKARQVTLLRATRENLFSYGKCSIIKSMLSGDAESDEYRPQLFLLRPASAPCLVSCQMSKQLLAHKSYLCNHHEKKSFARPQCL